VTADTLRAEQEAHGRAGLHVGSALGKEHRYFASWTETDQPVDSSRDEAQGMLRGFIDIENGNTSFFEAMDGVFNHYFALDLAGKVPSLSDYRKSLSLEMKEYLHLWLVDLMYIYYFLESEKRLDSPTNMVDLLYNFTMEFFDFRGTDPTILCVFAARYLEHALRNIYPHSSHDPAMVRFMNNLRHWLVGLLLGYKMHANLYKAGTPPERVDLCTHKSILLPSHRASAAAPHAFACPPPRPSFMGSAGAGTLTTMPSAPSTANKKKKKKKRK
jgi:hypothetical protein